MREFLEEYSPFLIMLGMGLVALLVVCEMDHRHKMELIDKIESSGTLSDVQRACVYELADID